MQVNEGNNEGRIRWGEKEKRPGCGSVSFTKNVLVLSTHG